MVRIIILVLGFVGVGIDVFEDLVAGGFFVVEGKTGVVRFALDGEFYGLGCVPDQVCDCDLEQEYKMLLYIYIYIKGGGGVRTRNKGGNVTKRIEPRRHGQMRGG